MKWRHGVGAGILAAGLAAALRAETVVVPPGDYPAIAEREIDGASRSVRLFLYLFSYRPVPSDSGPARLARALARAKSRGVDVQVVLDNSADALDPGAGDGKNQAAARFLAQSGAAVFLSSGTAPLHAKALIIDERTSLVGSSNWSASAFSRNAEADVLIRSTEAARALLDSFSSLRRVPLPAPSTSVTSVPLSFVDSPDGLGAVVRSDAPRTLNAYLHLLVVGASPGEPFSVDRDALAKAMGLKGPTKGDDRRQVDNTLVRLRDKYGLLTFQKAYDKDPVVTLSTSTGAESVNLPTAYFNFGWDRKLSLAGKAFLLWSLRYSAASTFPPRWSVAESTLARRYGVSPWFLQEGVLELRRADLLEVEYSPVTGDESRHPNIYTPNPLYDPAAREAKLKTLSARWGADAVAQAQSLAALVFDDSDVEGIEELIGLARRLDPKALQEAENILGAKRPDNPKRTMAYLLEVLRKMAG